MKVLSQKEVIEAADYLAERNQVLGRTQMTARILKWADENATKLREAGLMASLLKAVS